MVPEKSSWGCFTRIKININITSLKVQSRMKTKVQRSVSTAAPSPHFVPKFALFPNIYFGAPDIRCNIFHFLFKETLLWFFFGNQKRKVYFHLKKSKFVGRVVFLKLQIFKKSLFLKNRSCQSMNEQKYARSFCRFLYITLILLQKLACYLFIYCLKKLKLALPWLLGL